MAIFVDMSVDMMAYMKTEWLEDGGGDLGLNGGLFELLRFQVLMVTFFLLKAECWWGVWIIELVSFGRCGCPWILICN